MLDDADESRLRLLLRAQKLCFDALCHPQAQGVGLGEIRIISIEACAMQGRLHQGIVVHDLACPMYAPSTVIFL